MSLKRKPIVLISQKRNHDFSKAEEFGDLFFLFDHLPVNIFKQDEVKQKISSELDRLGFDKGDFLLLTGSMLLNVLLVLEVFRRVRKVRFLVYRPDIAEYKVFTLV
jgi:hypothetical protein